MANRQQNHQSGMRRTGHNRPWEEDDREYGQSARNDEDENSVRGGSLEQGRGRFAGYGDFGQGDYNQPGRGGGSGQDRYGQTGYGQGGYGQGNYGQPNYGQDYGSSGTSNYGRSNFGSGRYSRESEYSREGYGGEGSYGSPGGWREPYGEGQQYGQPYGQPSGQSSGQFGSRGSSFQANHRGKGPKNFQRSDERVKELLCERLHDDPEIDASEVTVNVQGGRITLEGTVESRRTKMMIEDVAEQIGVQDVQNNLRVQKQGERGMEAGTRSSATAKSVLGSEDNEQAKQKRN